MIVNKAITYYHKILNNTTKLEEWNKTVFTSAWVYSSTKAIANAGYENNNGVSIRIPIEFVKDISIFSIGDIVAIGKQGDITKQSDLKGKEFYNITNINVNDFGNNRHIHLEGK